MDDWGTGPDWHDRGKRKPLLSVRGRWWVFVILPLLAAFWYGVARLVGLV